LTLVPFWNRTVRWTTASVQSEPLKAFNRKHLSRLKSSKSSAKADHFS
jgi:hypothetical protein